MSKRDQPRYFILALVGGKWVKTLWTCSGDAVRPRPAKGRKEALRCLRVAREWYPEEKYKLLKVSR